MSLLNVEGLGITFGGLKAVEDVSFSVAPGEILSVIGPNGAGKTTLFNMISGIYTPGRGKVVLDGRDVTGTPPHLLARMGLSRTFQNLQIFQDMTVLDNVLAGFHLQERGSVLADLLSLPSMHRRAARCREGAMSLLARVRLDKVAAHSAGSLSYGSLKRLEIARALALNPRILLLDEPAAGMNEQETIGLISSVRTIRDRYGCGVVVIDHDLHFIMELSQRLYVMHLGQLLVEGDPHVIRHDPRVIEIYLGKSADKHTNRDATERNMT